MARTILVATLKGGSGKTTISVNLAAALAKAGRATALIDCDRQRSSLGWLGRRPANLAAIRGIDWTKGVREVPDGIDVAVIDAPAAMRGKDMEELVRLAERIVVPVVPSAFDAWATERFLRRLEEIRAIQRRKKPVGVVANRLRGSTRATERLGLYLAGTDHQVIATLRDAQAYLDVAETGVSLFERRSRRVEPLVAEWKPLLAFAEGGGA